MTSRRPLIPLVVAFAFLAVSFSAVFWLSNTVALRSSIRAVNYPAWSSQLDNFQSARSPKSLQTIKNQSEWFVTKAFQDHPICGGCYHAVAKPEENVRCGYLIHQLVDEGKNLLAAAQQINQEYPTACARCDPSACLVQEKKYWRYDALEQQPAILSSTVPKLGSIPSEYKIPSSAVASNLTAFFSSQQNPSISKPRYVFDYNPSLVLLPPALVDNFVNANHTQDKPAYLASFRVSTQQSCFHPYETQAMYGGDGDWNQKPPMENYLALALLRSDLSIIQDVTVDVKGSGIFQHFAEDFRLFVLSGQLYVASYDYIAPLHISPSSSAAKKNAHLTDYVSLENVYPSSLTVSMRSYPSCPVCHNRPNKRCGKNLNYFATTDLTMFVELWPSGPRITQQVDLQQSCRVARLSREEHINTFSDSEVSPASTTSWYTMEEIMFPRMEASESILIRGHGGACCVSVQHPQTGEELLVGIYHTKIPKFGMRSGKRLPLWHRIDGGSSKVMPNQYLSRWYAFRPTPPFATVTTSGLFCLGYPDKHGQLQHPLIQTTLWKTMIFGGDGRVDTGNYSLPLDCPRIHFVSGISNKADDASKVIVAYGINDCFSRLIEFEKAAIITTLFNA